MAGRPRVGAWPTASRRRAFRLAPHSAAADNGGIMSTPSLDLFWAPIEKHLNDEDDRNLWLTALPIVLGELDCEWARDGVPTPNRIHLVIARQSRWWRPHWNPPLLYGPALNGLGWHAKPDWHLHWYRNRRAEQWEYCDASGHKDRGNTSTCSTFFPARTQRHQKVSVVQIWKPPISPGLPIKGSRNRDTSWYPDGRRYLFIKGKDDRWRLA